MIEEVDDEGSCRTGEWIPALPIPGVPPSHWLALVGVLFGLQGRRCMVTEWPRMKRQGPRRRWAAVLGLEIRTTEWNTSSKHNTIKTARERVNIRMQLPPMFNKMVYLLPLLSP